MNASEFIVIQKATETHILPAAGRIQTLTTQFVAGGALMLVGGLIMDIVWNGAASGDGFAPGFYSYGGGFTAVLLWAVAGWTWRIQHIALVIETSTGAVRYGNKVLCAAGSVTAVRLNCGTDDEHEGACDVAFETGHKVKSIPSPLFAAMTPAVAKDLADTIATLLTVDVVAK